MAWSGLLVALLTALLLKETWQCGLAGLKGLLLSPAYYLVIFTLMVPVGLAMKWARRLDGQPKDAPFELRGPVFYAAFAIGLAAIGSTGSLADSKAAGTPRIPSLKGLGALVASLEAAFEANDISADLPTVSAKPDQERMQGKMVELMQRSIDLASRVSDGDLDGLHPHINVNFRDNLIGGQALYLKGLLGSDAALQVTAIKRLMAWQAFWVPIQDEIIAKLPSSTR